MTAPHALAVRNLSVRSTLGSAGVPGSTAPRRVISDVSFTLAPGSSVGLVGRSGAGKSTIGNAVLGLLPRGLSLDADSRITLGQDELTTLDAEALRRIRGRRIAMVFQEPLTALDPAMRIGRQLTAALEAHDVARGHEADERADAILATVGLRDTRRIARRYAHELSGGQRQRVLLALALLLRPEVIIADEPTTALDATLQAQILDMMDALRREMGTALLLISHDLDVVGERCERVLVLEDGKLVDDGHAERIVAARRSGASGTAAVARARAERPADDSTTDPSVPLVATDAMSVHYDVAPRLFERGAVTVRAVEQVSLRIARGECLGIVGESGSGKSTLARALLGLERPVSGRVTVLGRALNVDDAVMMRALRRRLQLVPQDAGASLTPERSIRWLLSEALEVHAQARGAAAAKRVDVMLSEVGLDPALGERRPAELSSGQRQRVAIARALAAQPDLLVCDEPVANLDAAARESLLAMLDALRHERGLAMVLISHDLGVVRRLATHVAVMYLGRIVEQGLAHDVLDAPQMPYTQLLRASVPTGRRRTPVLVSEEGDAPRDPPARGCSFFPRCAHPLKDEGCMSEHPVLRPVTLDPNGHAVACLKVPLPPSP
jgi:peptide/nickel transport system ATP-binding protein